MFVMQNYPSQTYPYEAQNQLGSMPSPAISIYGALSPFGMQQMHPANHIWQLPLDSTLIKNNRQPDSGNCWWDMVTLAFR